MITLLTSLYPRLRKIHSLEMSSSINLKIFYIIAITLANLALGFQKNVIFPQFTRNIHRFQFQKLITCNKVNRHVLYNLPTDEELENWLDDMIYSGDISGFVRRRSKDLVNDDFLDFVEDKLESCDDEEMKQVLTEISLLISNKLDMTDGLQDAGVVFEKRLDKILFTPPNQRKTFIEENKLDMTLGFIEYVQNEMKNMSDMDSKVVMASILQMIGQMKETDLLGSSASILNNADSSLGDQYAMKTSELANTKLAPGEKKGVKIGERNEQILASLLFSSVYILEDVLNNLHEINSEFVDFLQLKIDVSRDIDERVGLTSLRDTISSVLEKIKEADGSTDSSVRDSELTIEQVKQRMKEVQLGQELEEEQISGTRKYGEFLVQQDPRTTFLKVLERFQNLPESFSLKEAVEQNYQLCDYNFMELLRAEADDCKNQGTDIEAQQYTDILATINQVMADRIGGAQSRLDRILKKGSPKAMESEIGMMTRKGEVDEALILLIEANIQQAKSAGAVAASEVLTKLVQRVNLERDRIQPDEQRLLRALLKLDISEKRKGLLYDAFKPTNIQDQDGDWIDGPPLITPPAFINLVRNLITNFGNVDSFKIMSKATLIIDEAEVVAKELYGDGMSAAQQQRFMFEKKTMSVWDLANFEEQAIMSGEDVPWRNDKYDKMDPEDVLGERVKKIGGLEEDELR